MNRGGAWRWLGAWGGAEVLLAAALSLSAGFFDATTDAAGNIISGQDSGPSTATTRVLVEFFPRAAVAGGVGPSIPLLPQLDLFLNRSEILACQGPPVPGRPGRPFIISGALKNGIAIQQLSTFVKGLCERQIAKDGNCEISGVFGNPKLTAIVPVHGLGFGHAREVQDKLKDAGLWTNYGKGQGVLLAIVDEGFNLQKLERAIGSVSFDESLSFVLPGVSGAQLPRLGGHAIERSHGTMVAYDALIGAPKATLLDIRIPLRSDESAVGGAVCAFEHLSDVLDKASATQPMVVVNSWAVSTAQDVPLSPGVPLSKPCKQSDPRWFEPNASLNACHPINRAIQHLSQKADIVFAAGNKGSPLNQHGECIAHERGSILGVNSNPHVLTVAAANLSYEPLENSSVGPGQLDSDKPDLAAYSGFQGSGVYNSDSDTSAAAAVAAGVVAAMRTQQPVLTPAQLKQRLKHSVAVAPPDKWKCRQGAGVIGVPPLPAGGVSP